MVAEEMGSPRPPAAGACDRLIARAAAADSPVLRFGLLKQAIRCAFVAVDVPAGLRAADVLAAEFVGDAVHSKFLADLEAKGRAAPQTLVVGYLTLATRAGTDDAAFERTIAELLRIALRDEPPGLNEFVRVASDELQQVRRARARLPAPGEPEPARLRAFYFGEWEPLLAEQDADDDRVGLAVRSKIRARGLEGNVQDLARAGERWLSICRDEPDSLAQRHLRRRAIELMLPMVRDVRGADAPAHTTEELQEQERVRRLVDQTTALAAEPGVGVLRFANDADLSRLLITGGEWSVAEGELRGRSLGQEVATRATSRFAWKKIDAVTIRGGIRSADGLNFRVAVGPVNVLLNWEVADENHAWFGDSRMTTSPRALRTGNEHTIVLRQCGDDVTVAVDGKELFAAPAQLCGTISVYPAIGSEIFVRSIDVVGDVDLNTVVTGPGVAR